MILVDTSVWIDHLHHTEARLVFLLQQNIVLMHPLILGELACSNLQNRLRLLGLWQGLPRITTATDSEAMHFIHVHALMGKGIGFIDIHLLCALALEQGTLLWTRDKRLDGVAASLGMRYNGNP